MKSVFLIIIKKKHSSSKMVHRTSPVVQSDTAVFSFGSCMFGSKVDHHQAIKREGKNVLCITSSYIPYFPAHTTHCDFFVRNFRKKNNYECILILVIYWEKTGLLHTKISNHNIIYSS